MAKADLTREQLCGRLHYDPITGFLIWIDRPMLPTESARTYAGWRAKNIGKRAGGEGDKSKGGRRAIFLFGHNYYASHLAWLYMTGELPADEVDHFNCDCTDDSFKNLRPADRALQTINRRKARSDSLTGVIGTYRQASGFFGARIAVNGRSIALGSFPTLDEAAAAYVTAKRKFHVGCSI